MEQRIIAPSEAVYDAFKTFVSDTSLLALPLVLTGSKLEQLPAILCPNDPNSGFQSSLSQLDAIISPRTPLYLLLRRDGVLIAITYIPHLAPADLKTLYLDGRHDLVQYLGGAHFNSSLICKEPAEITDIRSWNERDMHTSECETCPEMEATGEKVKDLGHHKNKCRLCDRRMKNKCEESASLALRNFGDIGDCVQISVDMSTEMLQLNFYEKGIVATEVAAKIPTDHPSFTFYKHLGSRVIYFIFCSPDSVPVKERMTHTMAIPGLVNIIAKESGINIDQKIEIHDSEDLEFHQHDKRIGKFRSMYLRNEFAGTESTWENMEVYQKTLDSIR